MSFFNFLSPKKEIRTRLAPSPTGFIHVGVLRTALYSYLFAKQRAGKFILRIEDTDEKRKVEGATEAIYKGLEWAGLNWDEGPDKEGPYGPYIQSQRLDIYKKYAEELIKNKYAYYCFCSEETLERMREDQVKRGHVPKYDRQCRALSEDEIQTKIKAGESYVIRMKIPDGRIIEVNDIVRGKVLFNTNELDDQVLLKSDGYPTYHLAVVVDDHLMKISHVLRSEEWLPSTPKHVLLYEFFGWDAPKWAHLPLLLNSDKTKMSKRKGDVAVEDYIKKGYLPEAMVNFLAFVGWNPGTPAFAKASAGKEKEIYSMEELLKDFSLEKTHKAGAIFNIEKLDWFNGHYLRQLSIDELAEKAIPFLKKDKLIKDSDYDLKYIKKVLSLEQPRLKKLGEIGERLAFFFRPPEYQPELLIWRAMTFKDITDSLSAVLSTLNQIDESEFTRANLEKILLKEAERVESKDKGRLLWPLRAALTGLKASPGPFDVLDALGKKEGLTRIETAIKKLI